VQEHLAKVNIKRKLLRLDLKALEEREEWPAGRGRFSSPSTLP